MQKTITTKFLALGALLAIAFAFATVLTAYAYDEIEIEIELKNDRAYVDVTYTEDGTEGEMSLQYSITDLTEIYTRLAAELNLSADEVAAVAKVEATESEESDQRGDRPAAEEAIEDARVAIFEAEAYLDQTTSSATKGSRVVASAKEYLKKAKTAFTDKDYKTAVDKAEQAEDQADEVYEQESKDQDEANDRDEDRDKAKDRSKDDKKPAFAKSECDTNPGIGRGVKDRCDHAEQKLDRRANKYQDYGKSTDRAELQAQLQELMQLLIQLLTLQLANQTS